MKPGKSKNEHSPLSRLVRQHAVNGLSAASAAPGIYKIVHVDSGMVYVGSSKNIRRRGRRHVAELEKGVHGNAHLQRAWQKHGRAAFMFEVIEYVERASLIATEQKYIDRFQCADRERGFNIIPRADRREFSAETLAKISAALKGKNLGKTCSAETRSKIADALRGRVLSTQTIARRKATLSARSPHERALVGSKVGERLRGRPKSELHVKAMEQARLAVWEAKRVASGGLKGSGVQMRAATIRIGFKFAGKWCVENLRMAPTEENKVRAIAIAQMIRTRIAEGMFRYEEAFPHSKRAAAQFPKDAP